MMIESRDNQALPTGSKNMGGLADWFRSIFTVSNANYMKANPGKGAPIRSQAMPYNSTTARTLDSDLYRLSESQRRQKMQPYFAQYSAQYRIPYGVLDAIAKKETHYGSQQYRQSYRGARGSMQLMPAYTNGTVYNSIAKYGESWKDARTGRRVKTPPPYQGKPDPFNYKQSIHTAAWMLSEYYYPRYYNWAKTIAAYNSGAGTVARAEKYGANWRRALPRETQNYVATIGANTGIA